MASLVHNDFLHQGFVIHSEGGRLSVLRVGSNAGKADLDTISDDKSCQIMCLVFKKKCKKR